MNAHWKSALALFVPSVLLLLLANRILRPDVRRRNFEAFTEMVYSHANESQSVSSVLPGGLTQQGLVEGVVVHGQRPFRFGPGPEEAQRAGRELENPFTAEPAVLARGAEMYGVYCALCHGGDGAGQGRAVDRGVMPPPSLMGARALAMADGEIFHVVTLGQGNMGSHAVQIAAEDRWRIVHYVRVLQESAR